VSASLAESTLRAEQRSPDLDITSGDPLHRIERRLGLKPGTPPRPGRMVALLLAVAILPLVVRVGAQGQIADLIRDPFFIRLLIVLPLLELVSPSVSASVARALQEFETSRLVAPEDEPRFQAARMRALRMRDSRVALVVMVAIAFGSEVLAETARLPFIGAWARDGEHLTLAGSWYFFVSLALFHLIRLRWLWRILVWWRFLFGVSRIPLRLMPAHPDRAGGIGFLANVTMAFAPLIFGLSVGAGFELRARILVGGEKLASQVAPMVAISVLFLVCVLTPLLFFVPQLTRAMWRGRMDYDRLSSRYIRRFDNKWLSRDPPDTELLGSSDLQSLADLINSANAVRQMLPVPITIPAILSVALASGLAMLPAIQAEVPLREIAHMLMSALR